MEVVFEPKEFARKTVKVIKTPRAFFRDIEKEKGWKDAFVYSIAIAIIASFFGILQLTLLYPVFKSILPAGVVGADVQPQLLDVLPAFFMSTVLVVALGFVWSWVLNFWFNLWKMKGEFADAYKAFTYSRAPLSIFGWIPYVGGLVGLYTIYVLAVGISVHYKVTRLRAVLLLIPLILGLFMLQGLLFAAVSQMQ